MKVMKKMVPVLMAACIVVAAFPISTFAQYSSKEKADVLISTARQFNEFAAKVRNGNDFSGKLIKLTNDIVYDTSTLLEFGMVGDEVHAFKGEFDGCNHTISNIQYVNKDDEQVGLFAWIGENGCVENLTVKDSSFIGAWRRVGTIAGLNDWGIMNCHNVNTEVTGSRYCGGIVGENNGTIVACSNTGYVNGKEDIGGIAGRNHWKIFNCYNTGNLSGDEYTESIGGIAGENGENGIITNCYHTGSLAAEKASVGGIVGLDEGGQLRYCYYNETDALLAYNGSKTVESNVRSMTHAEIGTEAFANELNTNRGASTTWCAWELVDKTPTFAPLYEVTFGSVKNGVVKSDFSYANAGQKVTLTVVPNKKKKVKNVTVKCNGRTVAAAAGNSKKTTYIFTMPDGDVTVSAKCIKK